MRAAMLVVLLLAACAGAPPSSSPAPEPVRMLAQELGGPSVEQYSVAAFTTSSEYEQRWTDFERDHPAPAVDFASEIVVYLGMAGSSSCPEQFMGLVVDPETALVHGSWQDVSGSWQDVSGNFACTTDLQSQGYLLAVSRDVLPAGQFALSLREVAVCASCPEHPDQIVVSL